MLYTPSVLALLYDVHGNLSALEAVVADARAQGTERWLLGGDYTLFGPEPEGTLALLRSLSPAIWLRGNGERWTADPGAAPDNAVVPPAIAACREALGDADVAALAELPEQGVHEQTRYVHASPISDVRSFMPEPESDEQELLAGIEEPRLVFGHTHLPFRRISTTGGIELVNPGSVGLPFDGDQRAAFALVHPDRSVEHRRVAYDHGASAARLRERWPGAEWSDTVARRIEQARMDV
jgi:diadenosine tetraphosphatase ApaH/serine/threonine PP2A family protein phosphatase